MKFAAVLLTLAFGFNAYAVETIKCTVDAKSLGTGVTSSTTASLVEGRRSLINVNDSGLRLDLNVNGKEMDAYVVNFDVYDRKRVESKSRSASIQTEKASIAVRCEKGPEAKFVFINKFSRRVSVNEADVNGCYLGDAKSAMKAYAKKFGVKIEDSARDNAGTIIMKSEEEVCTHDNGLTRDENECYETSKQVVTRKIAHCNSAPEKIEVCTKKEVVEGPPRHMDEASHWELMCTKKAMIEIRD